MLQRLLDDHARVQTQDFLHTLPRFEWADKAPAATGETGERDVGPYRLLRELGRGGMGSVWLARRSDGVLRREVALKLPHPGLTTGTFAERLARERDILAVLVHPTIARLYDAGVTPEGEAYLAIEYVQGEPVTAYCDAQASTVRARVGLLLQVLSAVQHAHQALVVHRDLKPSNILVTPQGEVRLLDFGIAKLMTEGAHMGMGDPARALALDREIEPLLDTADAAHAMDTPEVRTNMAINRMATWHPDEAVTLLRRALDDWERLAGPDTPGAVSIQRSLGVALYQNGQFEQAVRIFDDNAARAVRVMGQDSPTAKLCESYSVRALIMAGRVSDAQTMARRSLEGPPNPVSTQTTSRRDFENRLGLALIFNRNPNEAARLLELRAAEARQAGLDTGDDYGRLLHFLAGAQLAQGRLDEAAQSARQAEKIYDASALGHDMYVALAQLTQALAVARGGHAEPAQQLIAQAEEHLRKVTRPEHPIHLLVQVVRAEALRAAGKPAEAERLDSEARERLTATTGAVLPKPVPFIF